MAIARDAFSVLPEWMDDQRVKCKGLTSFFFPNRPSSEVAKAKAVCNGLDGNRACPMRETCIRHAIDNHEPYGVWGGTSERDRRRIHQARKRLKNVNIYSLEDVKFPNVTMVKRRYIVFLKKRD